MKPTKKGEVHNLKLAHSRETDPQFLDGFKDTWNKAESVPYFFKKIPTSFTGSLQENVLTLVCISDKFCKSVQLNVPLELFSNHAMRIIAREAFSYVEAIGKAPREHLSDLLEEAIAGKDDLAPTILHIVSTILEAKDRGFNEGYVANQLYHFVELQQLKITVAALYKAAETEDLQEAKKAIYDSPLRIGNASGLGGVTATIDTYLTSFFTSDPNEPLFELGIKELDRHRLGPRRKELYNFMAPPKRGKSWWLIYLAKRALLARKKVLYITLEMSSDRIFSRILQGMFALSQNDDLLKTPHYKLQDGKVVAIVPDESQPTSLYSVKGKKKIRKAFAYDGVGSETLSARMLTNMRVGEFPTGSLQLQDLEGYLEHLEITENFIPDLVCLDYMDLMYVNPANFRINLSQLAQGIRGLAVRKNQAWATASQSNRASIKAETITEDFTAEDFSKIAISDVAFSYNQTIAEKRHGVARLFLMVARGAVDKFTVSITQSYATGQFCLDSKIIDPKTYWSMFPAEDDDEETRKNRRGARRGSNYRGESDDD